MSSGAKETTQKQEIDPRMQALLYGNGKSPGLYGQAQALYNANPSGMNDRMRQGLDTQYNYLTSPQYMQMMQQLMSTGGNLMGRGVAPNPYSKGGSMGFGGQQGQMQSYLAAQRPATQMPQGEIITDPTFRPKWF